MRLNEDGRLAVSVSASVISALLAGGLAITISSRQQAEIRKVQEEQRVGLCQMVVRLDNNARREPPTTELGRQNAEDYRYLRQIYRCDQG